MKTKLEETISNGKISLNAVAEKHNKMLDDRTKEKLTEIADQTEIGTNDIETETSMALSTLKNLVNKYLGTSRPHPLFPNVNAAEIQQTHARPVPPPHLIQASPAPNKDSSAFNVTGFHKHFMACMDSPVHILNFYQQLFTQGQLYGIYCVALTDINPYVDLCPKHFNPPERSRMATTIYQKLQNPDCVTKTFQAAQNILTTYASSSDGYKVLKQLLRFVHPRLNSQDVLREQPKLSKFSDIFSYADAMRNFVLVEHIQGRNYNDKEQSLMFCQYIDIDTYFSDKQRCIDEIIYQTHGDRPIQNADLLMDALPITVAKYHAQMSSTPHTGITTPLNRYLAYDDSTNDTDQAM